MRRRKGVGMIDLAAYAIGVTILASAAMTGFGSYLESGKIATAKADVASIAVGISRYKYEMGNYPAHLGSLTAKSGVYGPWINRLPASDPWGTTNTGINGTGGAASAYCYSYSTSGSGFAVWSRGKNLSNNSGGNGTTLPAAFSSDDIGVFGQ